jgi:hypothetical protein
MYVASQRKICLHYVTSAWFTLDVLSIVPSVSSLGAPRAHTRTHSAAVATVSTRRVLRGAFSL